MCIYWLFCITLSSSYWIVTQTCTINEQAAALLPGDIMIGGLFPMHTGVSNLLRQSDNESFICTSLQTRSMIEALSMIYAIETINNSTLLQGITMGYKIFDTCSHTLKAVHSALKLIPESDVNNITECSSRPTVYPVRAVVGETYSEISIAVSRLLGNYIIPQISPASSASTLSDKIRFPSFLRTVPSDTFQTKAIVELIKTFQWNWVGIVSSDDEYGRSALDLLNDLFKNNEICTAFSKIVSSYVDHPSLQSSINTVIEELGASTTNVVVVIAKGPIVSKLLKACIKANISKIWIASDSWSNSLEVLSTEDIEKVGTVVGINFKMGYVKGFEDYLRNLQPPGQGTVNHFLEEYQQLRYNCTQTFREYLECINSSKNCTLDDSLIMKSPLACQEGYLPFLNDNYLAENIEWSKTYSTYLAVLAIAQACNNLLCKSGKCINDTNFSPTQLLEELKNNNFSYNGDTFKFDSSGDLLIGYDVLTWQSVNQTKEVRIIGEYTTLNGSVIINRSLLLWNTDQNQVPFSNCSKSCLPGYYRKYSYISCCNECVACTENYYSPNADMTECQKCTLNQWSKNGSSHCENRTIEYFKWNDPFAITLVTFAAVGALVVLLSMCLFMKNGDTPAVKAAGGHYTYLFMISLLCSLASIGFFIGEPNNTVCKIRQPLYGISFTVSVSCILIKSMRILLAFESASRGKKLVTLTYQPIMIVSTLTGIQISICIIWLVLKGPYFIDIYNIPEHIIFLCDEGSYVAFGIMLGYIGLLALVCFLLAYKGRKLPEKYNEARCITFSMLVYMFVWLLFIPIYVNISSGVYPSAVQALAILASIYGMISCHILPVCYIVIFKRASCNREKYLQSTFMFYRAKRSVFSVCQKPPDKEAPFTKTKQDIEAVQVIRKRHKSC
ncbi:PREDICTED: G-protein coupled receptor family C group 6 member A-like [Nanorana parkeri]|uniref:G-protein coupled receptor family C group 6 member A-like n=1 Tax=Nanorana parkeri TaxID=125878 RepID=UPI00085471EE|nr:PREDICTED: G-protein coupled receptor family C group 6 member A-like [Nanorana parkeri]